MNRFIITGISGKLFAAKEEESRITELYPQEAEKETFTGSIFVGRVKHIKKDLQAAFIEYLPGEMCYYPLSELQKYPVPGVEVLHEGDLLPVQLEQEPVKMKQAKATTNLTLTGEYLVLMSGKQGASYSGRLREAEEKERLRLVYDALKEETGEDTGIIFRTNAKDAPASAIRGEYVKLLEELRHILRIWNMRTMGTLLRRPENPLLTEIYNNQLSGLSEIVTDRKDIFDILTEKQTRLQDLDPERKLPVLRLYEDAYPLEKLYRLEKVLSDSLQKKVWLKSGGFLVVEPTEALVAIDVNTGKAQGKKTPEETFFRTNLEAVKEIALQLRLRNLSGIIIIDFIDMKEEAHRKQVERCLIEALEKDPVKTAVLGFTKLGLLEMTRKKIRKPLHELCNISR